MSRFIFDRSKEKGAEAPYQVVIFIMFRRT